MSILNPWVLLGLAAAFAGSYFYGRHDGSNAALAAYQARDNDALIKAVEKVKKLTGESIALEHAHADALAAVSEHYQQEIKNERIKKDGVISSLRAGTIRLRDPNGKCSGVGITLPETGPGPERRDGGAGTELSQSFAELLISEASRADEVVRQLTACQSIIIKDRGIK